MEFIKVLGIERNATTTNSAIATTAVNVAGMNQVLIVFTPTALAYGLTDIDLLGSDNDSDYVVVHDFDQDPTVALEGENWVALINSPKYQYYKISATNSGSSAASWVCATIGLNVASHDGSYSDFGAAASGALRFQG